MVRVGNGGDIPVELPEQPIMPRSMHKGTQRIANRRRCNASGAQMTRAIAGRAIEERQVGFADAVTVRGGAVVTLTMKPSRPAVPVNAQLAGEPAGGLVAVFNNGATVFLISVKTVEV